MTTKISPFPTQTSITVNDVDKLVITESNGTKITGTTTNDNAGVGIVGEYFEAQRLFASPLAMTTAVAASITSIPLTAGDWDVQGQVGVITTGTTTVSYVDGHINTSVGTPSADFLGLSRENYVNAAINTPGIGTPVLGTGVTRISLSAPTTVHLVGRAGFAVSTLSMFGAIHARRVR